MTGGEAYFHGLQEVVQLSEEAEAAARQQDWEGLNDCLSRRQSAIDRVSALPDGARWLSPTEQLRARQMLQRAAELDATVTATLDTALTSTRSVLQEGSQTRAGISAYRRLATARPQTPEARFVDKNR